MNKDFKIIINRQSNLKAKFKIFKCSKTSEDSQESVNSQIYFKTINYLSKCPEFKSSALSSRQLSKS